MRVIFKNKLTFNRGYFFWISLKRKIHFSNYFLSFLNPNNLVWFEISSSFWSVAPGKIGKRMGKKLFYLEEYFFKLEIIFPGSWGQEKWVEKKFCKFEAKGQEFVMFLRFTVLGLSTLENFKITLEQIIQTVKGQNNYGNRLLFRLFRFFPMDSILNKCKNSAWRSAAAHAYV